MNNEFIDLVNHKSSKTLLCGKSGILQKIRSLFTISRLSKKIIPLILRDTWQAANNVKPELIIAHPKVLSASHICEAFNIPLVIASPIPTFEATDEFPLVGLPQLTLFTHNQTKWYNKLTYKLSRRAFHVFDKTINDFRANTLGLSSCDPFSTPIKNHLNQSIIHLHAISPSVIHKPHDWRKLAYMTGYWFLEKTDNWQAPRLLTQFIAAKPEPIVYIGFGSMAANNAVALGQLIIQALKNQKRGLLLRQAGAV